MGVHIIRRSPVHILPSVERHPMTELIEQQLHALIHSPANDCMDHPHGEFGAEIELIDILPEVFPDATP
jgi:hypothetical protein